MTEFEELRPLLFSIASIATPIVAVVVLLALFRMRHIELERWPAGRAVSASAS